MKCLVCFAHTTDLQHEGVPVHVCPKGHGLWMTAEDLLIAVRTDPASGGRTNTPDEVKSVLEVHERDVEPGDETRVCPMDGKIMGSVRYAYTSDIVIDACAEHGIWLDTDELDKLEEWAAARFAALPARPTPTLPTHAEHAARRARAAAARNAAGGPVTVKTTTEPPKPAPFMTWLRRHLAKH